MADSKIDPFEVGALERAVNDSATRVSAIWLSFVAFSAYLASAASTISHRQLILQDPIKLPTINIDVPLVVSAILLPSLFVIYHIYVLLQVVLLARTADAYNSAVERNVSDDTDQILLRQRLANTLFAQLFAGSSREREGLLGWLLKIMAWVTLALAPPLVLLVYQLQFLPYHSIAVTWIHRLLIAFDLVVVLFLWAGAVDPRNDITLRRLFHAPISLVLATALILFSCIALTFPGETQARWTRSEVLYDPEYMPFMYGSDPECHRKSFLVGVLSPRFDRIDAVGEQMVDGDKLKKIEEIAKARGQKPYEGERTRNLRGRDLRCGNLGGVDLRRADFTGANLSGVNLATADLQGAVFKSKDTNLQHSALDGALMQGANLEEADLQNASLSRAHLEAAMLNKAMLQNTNFLGAKLAGAEMNSASLQGSRLEDAELQKAQLKEAHLEGANLKTADLSEARLAEAHLERATLSYTNLSGADFERAQLAGANLYGANLRGANLRMAILTAVDLSNARLEGARLSSANLVGVLLADAQLDGALLLRTRLIGASAPRAKFGGAILVQTQLQASELDRTEFDHAFIDRTLFWRSSLANCKSAQVIQPRFEDAIDAVYGVHSMTGERLDKATPEAVKDLITEVAASLTGDEAGKRQSALQQQFAGEGAEAAEKAWLDCSDASAAREDHHRERAAFLLKNFCGVEPQDFAAVRGLYKNWLRPYQGFEQNAEFNQIMAARLLGRGEPCPGAAALDAEAKQELAEYLKEEKEKENDK